MWIRNYAEGFKFRLKLSLLLLIYMYKCSHLSYLLKGLRTYIHTFTYEQIMYQAILAVGLKNVHFFSFFMLPEFDCVPASKHENCSHSLA